MRQLRRLSNWTRRHARCAFRALLRDKAAVLAMTDNSLDKMRQSLPLMSPSSTSDRLPIERTRTFPSKDLGACVRPMASCASTLIHHPGLGASFILTTHPKFTTNQAPRQRHRRGTGCGWSEMCEVGQLKLFCENLRFSSAPIVRRSPSLRLRPLHGIIVQAGWGRIGEMKFYNPTMMNRRTG